MAISKEQHLFLIEIFIYFCNIEIICLYIYQFDKLDAFLLIKSIHFFKKLFNCSASQYYTGKVKNIFFCFLILCKSFKNH